VVGSRDAMQRVASHKVLPCRFFPLPMSFGGGGVAWVVDSRQHAQEHNTIISKHLPRNRISGDRSGAYLSQSK